MVPEEGYAGHATDHDEADVFMALSCGEEGEVEDEGALHFNEDGPEVHVVAGAVAVCPKVHKLPHVISPVV